MEAVLNALNAERYGRSLWWKAPVKGVQDDDLTTARRRRLMAEDFERTYKGETA